MPTVKKEQVKHAHTWLSGLLCGWGIKESWAKIAAGAIIGAGIFIAGLTLTDCTYTATRNADGTWECSGIIIIPVTNGAK